MGGPVRVPGPWGRGWWDERGSGKDGTVSDSRLHGRRWVGKWRSSGPLPGVCVSTWTPKTLARGESTGKSWSLGRGGTDTCVSLSPAKNSSVKSSTPG